ncbi:MAG TPA: Gx transporter family protein [Candidatus Fusicatenibacter intestinigallinarum]|uniref:Gx transporter family protein n=1 Tax=Candidatus Fusicatenibacter intestinigallinarum TaxID=2838598 RepID=A0A9D2ND97_9FIRM|nr:Gx transporter family protein [Candidatus Fusicatenibacter intestinigallinarum]
MQSGIGKRVAVLGLCAAGAILLGYVESLIPVLFFVPGMKLGLANLAIVITLYFFGPGNAAAVQLVRIVVVGFLFGNLFSIAFSLAGGFFSLAVMCLAKRYGGFTVYGVSVAGGVSHNIGQICVAAVLVENVRIVYYLPILLLSGLVTGLLIGLAGDETMRRLKTTSNFFF